MILKSRENSLFYCHFYKGVLSSPHITLRVGTFCCSLEGAGSTLIVLVEVLVPAPLPVCV